MAARKQAKKRTLCITDGCDNMAQSRGLCWSCLSVVRSEIRAAGDSLAQDKKESLLVRQGRILKAKRAGRPTTNPLALALRGHSVTRN